MDQIADPTNGQLRSALERLRDNYRVCPGAVYINKEDLLLRHGQFFEPQPLPGRYRRRRGKECFANAFKLATRRGLRYVEGVAVVSFDIFLPIHHAWCLDADNRVIDPTWPTPGLAYFGVVFDLKRVAEAWSVENQSVLEDWPNKWPALRAPYAAPNP